MLGPSRAPEDGAAAVRADALGVVPHPAPSAGARARLVLEAGVAEGAEATVVSGSLDHSSAGVLAD
jgi:hypothetical protein